ncbi:MAG: aldehyde ferredoxin oxidoreductase C-terminal domain-containing protein, partial [Dehalococcoidia bacterium]|nr:aldehyde ferredoxin oxidoreductase C-terminal domain-containing protein [Dehalococcoidia bacterium]
KPVYLFISDDKVEIKDAAALWGMTTGDTQDVIKDELGDNKVRIACIGPAGENLVLYAAIISERRAAGRGGAGAVMGSKNLKAIALRGTGAPKVADPAAFRTAIKRANQDIENNPVVSKMFPLYGSLMAMPALNEGGIIPWRNWQDASQPGCVNLFAQTWREKFVKKDVRCAPPCNVKCSKLTVAREGPYAGVLTEGPDYEAEYSLGACCDITDQTAVIQADSLCDQYGLDTISMGVSIAFAMECYEKGIITNRETGGDEVRFGRADLLAKLIHETAYRRGFGELLAQGTRRMSEKFGKGSEAFAMQVKGMELGGYDPRGAKSVALVFACGSRGGCHKSGGSANAQSLKELPTGDKRFSTEGKAAITKWVRERRVLADTATLCVFPEGALSAETTAELLSAATGFKLTPDDLYRIGERGSNIERAFNVREGARRSWDTLPKRLLTESVKSGPTKGQIVELDVLLDDFYKLCGWDLKTGIPMSEKLKELGLDEIARDMAGYLKKSKLVP